MIGKTDAQQQLETVPIRLPDGETLHAVVTNLGGTQQIADKSGWLEFDEVMGQLEGITALLSRVVKKASPTKASIEFAVQLATKSGKLTALLVQGEATASAKFLLEWAAPPEER